MMTYPKKCSCYYLTYSKIYFLTLIFPCSIILHYNNIRGNVMPLYEAMCHKCNKVHSYYAKISDRHDTPVCCGSKSDKVILTTCPVYGDIPNWDRYVSPASGKLITSRAERQADMKATGCREWEGFAQEKKAATKSRAEQVDKLADKLDKGVEQAWAQLPQEKKDVILKG